MTKRTSNASYTALAAGIMAIITLFGGPTVFLGVVFAVFALVAALRGRREQATAAARWALIVAVVALLLTVSVGGLYLLLYVYGTVTPHFGPGDFYEKGKELLLRIIDHL